MTLKDFMGIKCPVIYDMKTGYGRLHLVENRPVIVCGDGFKLSVQASTTHYCFPRETNAEEYKKVECGFPSDEDVEEIEEYDEDGTCSIFAYVPVEKLDVLFERRGGIDVKKTIENIKERYNPDVKENKEYFIKELMKFL
jgi:Zn/Cd-binding protein ZinT